LYGKYGLKKAEHLAERVRDIESGKFDDALDELVTMDENQLKEAYANREIEEV
jgi:hypothetical protein